MALAPPSPAVASDFTGAALARGVTPTAGEAAAPGASVGARVARTGVPVGEAAGTVGGISAPRTGVGVSVAAGEAAGTVESISALPVGGGGIGVACANALVAAKGV